MLDDSAAYSAITANSYKNFEISMWDWYPLTDPDFMLSVLTCGSWNVWNDTGYCSKSYDSLYQAQSAAASAAKRQQIVYQMQQMIASQRVYLVLDYADSIEAHSTAWAACRWSPASRGTRCPRSRSRACTRRAEAVRSADYVIKRGFFALVTVFVAITINFFLFRVLPGSAVTDLSRVPKASPQLRHALTVEFGLDKPKWQQYVIYLRELFHGNMGISFTYQQPVSHLLIADLKNTIPMVTVGTVAAIVVGVVTGILSAWRRVVHHRSRQHERGHLLLRVPDPVARPDAAHHLRREAAGWRDGATRSCSGPSRSGSTWRTSPST